jgi:shikimate dehydrogenase
MIDLPSLYKDLPRGAKKLAVVGWPLGHTLSPAMHTAAMASLGFHGAYRAIPVSPEEWDAFIVQAKSFLDGMNVTVPHKERAAALSDLLAPSTGSPWKAIGAVNTLGRTSEGWRAWNTDVDGFFGDTADLDIRFTDKRVVVVGAGGAARAILFGFNGRDRPSSVVVADVDRPKAERLAAEVLRYDPDLPLQLAPHADAHVAQADVVVNATPVGLKVGDPSPVDLSTLRPTAAVYDLIYHRETAFRLAARARGARDFGGLGMLVQQGASAFEHWFGEQLGRTAAYGPGKLRRVMREAAEAAMKETSS